jgi:hypothetical protein
MRHRLHSRLAPAAVVLSLLCTSACAVPLAPGYRIRKESREVRFVPGSPPALQVRAHYTLENTGNSGLTFVDISFPDERAYGRKNLRVEVDGRDATLADLPKEYQQESPGARRVMLDPPWQQKQRRELAIEYVLSSPEDSGTRITLGPADFHLGPRGWFPVLEPPRHVLSPYPTRPYRTMYSVRVPAGFNVLAGGGAAGRKQNGGEIEYRYDLRRGDLGPYIVAGRYAESSPHHKAASAVFWTLEPLQESPAQTGEKLAAAWGILEKSFGSLDRNFRTLRVVESPELRAHYTGEQGAVAASFPGGALVNPETLALGIGSEAFLGKVTHALAHNWFSDEMYPSSDSAVGLGEGLPEYATIVIDEARLGNVARRQRVLDLLHEYDEARKRAVEKPLGVLTLQDPLEQRRIGFAKAPLFFVALEDGNGRAAVGEGLKQLVASLRGREVGYDDLRAALEQATGKNLAEPFRVWLYQKGIPKEFRDRYTGNESDEKIEKAQGDDSGSPLAANPARLAARRFAPGAAPPSKF